MPVFYRKYRPQRFAEMVGQVPIVQTLKNAVSSGTVSHAYLFTGSRGIGKTSVARILAKAINCEHPTKDGDADGKCEICLAITEGNFLDLMEIDAASNTGVENVRELIEHVKFKPSRAKFKVFIIDEVHMLSKAAFNALLKTLEEPPAHAIFILATTDIHKVPDTIISRTQRFDFKKLSEAEIVAHLGDITKQEKLKISDDVLRLIASGAQGGLRDALSLLEKLSTLGEKIELAEAQSLLGLTSLKLSQELVEAIASHQTEKLPAMFNSMLESGIDFAAFNRDLLEYLRKVLVYKIVGDKTQLDLLPDELAILKRQSQSLQVNEITHIIRLFLRAYKELATSPSPDLPMLLASVEAGIGKTAVVQAVAAAKPLNNFNNNNIERREIIEPVKKVIIETREVEEKTDPITQEEVTAFWPDVIEKIKTINSPLATLIKNSPLQNVDNNTITLGVKYLFHKEHLESKKTYAVLTGAIKDICGKSVRLSIKIVRNGSDQVMEAASPIDMLGDALKVFGGELVD